jgi:hypothetical protein
LTLKQVCSGLHRSASCVQRFDDSRSAIRITYRISLRSSSSREPRYPLLKVLSVVCMTGDGAHRSARPNTRGYTPRLAFASWLYLGSLWGVENGGSAQTEPLAQSDRSAPSTGVRRARLAPVTGQDAPVVWDVGLGSRGNDPSAGSPTETLLRLHLPLDDEVYSTSRTTSMQARKKRDPEISPSHPIGRCDGRCVQRAGT